MEHLMNIRPEATASGTKSFPSTDGNGPDMKALMQHADSLWKFLDDLAESDPEGYKSFLQQQAKESYAAAAASKKSAVVHGKQPVAIIQITASSPCSILLWPASTDKLVPMPSTGIDALVSCSANDLHHLQIPMHHLVSPPPSFSASDNTNSHHLVLNPKLLQQAAAPASRLLRGIIIEAACQFLEAKYKPQINRNALAIKWQASAVAAGHDGQVPEVVLQHVAQGTSAQELPDSLLHRLGTMSLATNSGTSTSATSSSSRSGAVGGSAPAKKPLIQELVPGTSPVVGTPPIGHEHLGMSKSAATPGGSQSNGRSEVVEYSQDGQRWVSLDVSVEGASCAADISVEVEGRKIFVRYQDSCQEYVSPVMVDDNRLQAKFDGKRKLLKLKAPAV